MSEGYHLNCSDGRSRFPSVHPGRDLEKGFSGWVFPSDKFDPESLLFRSFIDPRILRFRYFKSDSTRAPQGC
ncbi:MAG: hypothetical protein CMJ95_04335 [Planctomycetes bacterium]|nr:hypothetical protein [Planctomycetota bacterium]